MNAYTVDQHYLMALDTLRNGGGTYNPHIFRPRKLLYRYVLALGEPSAVVDAGDREGLIAELRRFSELRGVWTSDERALGTWVHEGKVYIDVVESVDDLTKALDLADERGQLAIWDSEAGVSIEVPSGQPVAA